MFEIGFPELILIAVVGLLVIGPERLPEALRTLGLWFGRMRRSFTAVKTEIEKEIGMDEIKRQLHNEAIMEEMKRIESEVKGTVEDARTTINEGVTGAGANSIQPPSTDSETTRDAFAADPESGGPGKPAGPLPAGADGDHNDLNPTDRDHTDAGRDGAVREEPLRDGAVRENAGSDDTLRESHS